ncbi:MAG TPA: response regulator transcription factor, partial [Actinomycetota bacterium]
MPGAGGSLERLAPATVLIAEGHEAYRELIRSVCDASGELQVAAEFADAGGAVSWWERHPVRLPDIVALDLEISGTDGLELARRLLEDAPDTAVLGVSDVVEDRTVLDCIRAGLAGLVEREAGQERLSVALGALTRGASGYDVDQERAALRQLGRVARQAREYSDVAASITPRELEVLGLISEGL